MKLKPGEGELRPPPSKLDDVHLVLQVFAKLLCLLSLDVRCLVGQCGSHSSVGDRPYAFYVKPFVSVVERTLEVSS